MTELQKYLAAIGVAIGFIAFLFAFTVFMVNFPGTFITLLVVAWLLAVVMFVKTVFFR